MIGRTSLATQQFEALLGGFEKRHPKATTELSSAAPWMAYVGNGWLGQLVLFAGKEQPYSKALVVRSLSLGGGIALLLVGLRPYFMPLCLLPGLVEILILKRLALKRAHHFEKDYPPFLISLATSIKTGRDPFVALSESKDLFTEDSEIYKQLDAVKKCMECGGTEEQALKTFGLDLNYPDVSLFSSAYILARREGASLSECLHRLAKVTRQRQSFRRKVRAAIAMQKLSAFGIAGCSLVICTIQMIGSPDAFTVTFADPVGGKVIIAGAALILVGLFWMLRISKAKI